MDVLPESSFQRHLHHQRGTGNVVEQVVEALPHVQQHDKEMQCVTLRILITMQANLQQLQPMDVLLEPTLMLQILMVPGNGPVLVNLEERTQHVQQRDSKMLVVHRHRAHTQRNLQQIFQMDVQLEVVILIRQM